MDAYTSFAQVYDLFMDNVPYDEWCAYICETLKKHGVAVSNECWAGSS